MGVPTVVMSKALLILVICALSPPSTQEPATTVDTTTTTEPPVAPNTESRKRLSISGNPNAGEWRSVEDLRPEYYEVGYDVEDVPNAPYCVDEDGEDTDYKPRKVVLHADRTDYARCGTRSIELASAQIDCECDVVTGTVAAPGG